MYDLGRVFYLCLVSSIFSEFFHCVYLELRGRTASFGRLGSCLVLFSCRILDLTLICDELTDGAIRGTVYVGVTNRQPWEGNVLSEEVKLRDAIPNGLLAVELKKIQVSPYYY